jgi:hypothetical protein
LDNFKEIFALQNADLEQYTLLCTTGTELYAINSNNAETSLAIALSTLDYNTERITDKFFVDINSFALGPDNQLLLLDRGSNLLYKYDASGFLTNDNIAANRLFFKKFIGGYGDIQAKLKFNSPESVCMSNDFIYVLDSGNSCIKKYDKYLKILDSIEKKKSEIDKKESYIKTNLPGFDLREKLIEEREAKIMK